MSVDITGFDPNAVPEDDFAPMPGGWYRAMIVESEERPTKSGLKMVVLQVAIISGEYAKRLIFDNLCLWHEGKAQQIAKRRLADICIAVGVTAPRSTADLHNRPLEVRLGPAEDNGFGPQNPVKGYRKLQTAGSAPATPPQPPQATQQTPPYARTDTHDVPF